MLPDSGPTYVELPRNKSVFRIVFEVSKLDFVESVVCFCLFQWIAMLLHTECVKKCHFSPQTKSGLKTLSCIVAVFEHVEIRE